MTHRLSKKNLPKSLDVITGRKRGLKLNTPRTLMRLMQQHRENERHRHRGLNASINDIVKRIPGYSVHPKGSKIDKLRRVIAYICYLEDNIQNIFQELGVTNSFVQRFLSVIMAKPAPVRAVTRRSRRGATHNDSVDDLRSASTHAKKPSSSSNVKEAEEMLSDEPDNMWSASDTEFHSDNDDSFITQSDDLRFETELQQLRDRKPDESEFALEQSSSRKKWPRMDKEPVNVEEPIVKVIDVKRVTEESISRPVVCRNLPAVRMTHAVNGSSDGRSRTIDSWRNTNRESSKDMPSCEATAVISECGSDIEVGTSSC